MNSNENATGPTPENDAGPAVKRSLNTKGAKKHKENKRERDVSEIDWSGLGDVVMKRYFARLKKDGLLPPYLEKYLVEEEGKL